jgi:photosystem II stability/assembly factor-like uncharacterized protein
VIAVPPPGHSIAFVDAQHGWVAGRGGLLGSIDGRRFRVESHRHVIGISAVGRRRAWAITGGAFVLRTTDGEHWQRLVAPNLVFLRFVDARDGFGLTRLGVVVKSTDGGRIWRRIRTPGSMQSVCFADTRNGWIVRKGMVWTTHDGGLRWRGRRLLHDREGYPLPDAGCRGTDVWVLFHGGVAAGSEGYVVFRSRDRGSSWRPVLANLDQAFTRRAPPISTGYSGPFDVLGRGRAVFVGICGPCGKQPTGTFARTGDGGRTWRRATPFDGIEVDAVSFLDLRHGFALTSSPRGSPRRGLLWKTSNGGRTWRQIASSKALAQ